MNVKRLFLAAAASITAVALPSTSVSAATTLGGTSCSLNDLSITATSCVGFFEGNLVSGNPTALADSAAIINSLIGTSYTGSTLSIFETLPSLSGSTINFATPLYGQTVIAVHTGAARGQANGVRYQGSAFYVFDAGTSIGGLDKVGFNRPGLSNARLFLTTPPAVPEPATWAMMLLGFFGVGGMVRSRRRKQKVAVSCV